MSFTRMLPCFIFFLSLIEVVYQLKVTASYTTSFRCSDGSYALMRGANLTLKYDYGHNFSEVWSFHLYEVTTARHMFDYEYLAGKAFIKDKRLKSYDWTDTGIMLWIPNIDNKNDLGKYQGDVATEEQNSQNVIAITKIFDPPAWVKISTGVGTEIKNLYKGFGEYVLSTSAESYSTISCSSVIITWMSSKEGNVLTTCQAEDGREKTVCPLTINESEMMPGNCTMLEVYAEQYGVQSEKKAYVVCYHIPVEDSSSVDQNNTTLIVGLVTNSLLLLVIIAITAVYVKKKGQFQQYKSVSQADNSDTTENLIITNLQRKNNELTEKFEEANNTIASLNAKLNEMKKESLRQRKSVTSDNIRRTFPLTRRYIPSPESNETKRRVSWTTREA